MALGDGVRRNIRTVTGLERQRFARALLALQGDCVPESEGGPGQAGLTYWFRQVAVHCQHERKALDFLPWHRELCNRFEELLRQVDPELSLHYWDWNDDPRDLFTPTYTVDAAESAPEFQSAVAAAHAWRGSATPDVVIVQVPTFRRLTSLLEPKHAEARFAYYGGSIVNAHVSLHDPLGLLLHSNLDRLFAMWQAESAEKWRLDPSHVYGDADRALVTQFVEPWSTELPLRPWVVPPLQAPKTYAHASLVAPPCYDTMPASVTVDEGTNPGNVIRFQDVYSGRTFARAACFRVIGRGNLSFSIVNGPTSPYTVLTPGGAVRSLHAPTLYQEVRIWFGYTGGAPGDVAPMGTVVIRCDDTGEEFEFTLQANSVALPFSATAKEPDRVGGSAAPGLLSCSQLVGVTWTWTWRALACPPSAGRAATDAAHLSRATGRAIW